MSGSEKNGAPEGTVEWKPEFSLTSQEMVRVLREKIKPRVAFMLDLQKALKLSNAEFFALLAADEFKDVPVSVPQRALSVSKILDSVLARGGKIQITISFYDEVTNVREFNDAIIDAENRN